MAFRDYKLTSCISSRSLPPPPPPQSILAPILSFSAKLTWLVLTITPIPSRPMLIDCCRQTQTKIKCPEHPNLPLLNNLLEHLSQPPTQTQPFEYPFPKTSKDANMPLSLRSGAPHSSATSAHSQQHRSNGISDKIRSSGFPVPIPPSLVERARAQKASGTRPNPR